LEKSIKLKDKKVHRHMSDHYEYKENLKFTNQQGGKTNQWRQDLTDNTNHNQEKGEQNCRGK